MADLSQVENMTANKLLAIVNDESQTKDMRAAAKRELATRSMGQDTTKALKRSEGGDTPKRSKKKVPAISISVGMVEIPKGKGKAKMMKGGMANGRQHMYLNDGGLVTDNLNPGLQALAKKRPDVVKKILKKS
tara:strand:- start:1033 stop:1431 length:399 start_codon:yes stop_codon:yes gene_type:complete